MKNSRNWLSFALCLLLMATAWHWPITRVAHAQEEPAPEKAEPAPPKPYGLPWQMRPIFALNVLRLDAAISFYTNRSTQTGGTAIAQVLTGSYRVADGWAAIVRQGWAIHSPPGSLAGAATLTNPLLGVLRSLRLSDSLQAGFFFAGTLPIGMGGGNTPDISLRSANSASILTRSAMDNALFAPNYLTLIPGIDLAYLEQSLTVQAEVTLLQLIRTRGSAVDTDPVRTNFTSALSAGYALSPKFFAIGELRYQRWLNNKSVEASARPATQNLTFAFGPRLTFKTNSMTLRPGIAYSLGIAGPVAREGYTFPTHSHKTLFIDFPILF